MPRESLKAAPGPAWRVVVRIIKRSYPRAMYPSAPPDAYNKFSTGAPPTAPPPAAYHQQQQQHGVNMNPSRPGGGLRKWSTGLFHCMDDPGNCKSSLPSLLLPLLQTEFIAVQRERHLLTCVSSMALRSHHMPVPLHHVRADR